MEPRIKEFNDELKALLVKHEVGLFARPIFTTDDNGLLVQIDSQFQVVDKKPKEETKAEAPVAEDVQAEELK